MIQQEELVKDLLRLLERAFDQKIYGSVEVFLEEGQITQVTQRIINKVKRPTSMSHSPKTANGRKTDNDPAYELP